MDSAPENGSTTSATASTSANPALSGSIDIPEAVLVPCLQIPFAIPAAMTGFKGFALHEEEAKPLVPLTNACINQYLPGVVGPHAALAMLAVSLLMLAGTKFIAYQDYKRAQVPVAQSSPVSA